MNEWMNAIFMDDYATELIIYDILHIWVSRPEALETQLLTGVRKCKHVYGAWEDME
jgi:hypothetical protein